jgi:hypothetical protein
MMQIRTIVAAGLLGLPGPAFAQEQPTESVPSLAQAEMLVPFGGRAAISPDGKRIAFVGKTYGDAYELEIATGRLRNLSGSFPHQGIMRIQYLPNGDFLVTAPRVQFGPNTRAHLEMWLLRKDLSRGLEPLGETVFEGIAVSRRRNLIAWTTIEPAADQGKLATGLHQADQALCG